MNKIGNRIKDRRLEHRLTQKELALKVGVTSTAISQWEREETEPKGKNLAALSKALNVTIEWLTTSIKPPINTIEDTELSCVLVAFYPEVNAAGGSGYSVDVDEDESYTAIPTHVLRYRNLNNIACITVTGDSMEPVLIDGSIIAIDRDDKIIRDGKLYVFKHNDLLRVKCLRQTPEHLIVQSYNIEYKDEYYDRDIIYASNFEIVGRVFWISSEV